VVPFAVLLCNPFPGSASTLLGSAQSFAVLGGSAVTNTGSTTLNGDLGVYPGSSISPGSTGFTFIGASTTHNTPAGLDPVSQQAQVDLTAAYIALAALSPTSNLTGSDLGTVSSALSPLAPGVYHFDSSAQLTGNLYLDFSSNPGGNFIFQIGSTLTTASASNVYVSNPSSTSGVYWQVGSSATLGTTTAFQGNIVALTSITMNTGATILCGRALARNGAVTLDTNTISDTCETDNGSLGYSGGSGEQGGEVPEPGTLTLLSMGAGAGLLLLRKFRFVH
jgi:type VI secretion system secreted protein VgrG